jgi:pilus assembly protein CpaE
MTEASVVAVGTPQSFRQQLARTLEVGPEEVEWVQSATAAEELLISADRPVDVLVLSPEVKEPDALGLAEFVGRQAPGTAIVLVRDHTWNGLLPAAMRAGIRDVVDMTQGTEELRDAVERAIGWAMNLRSVGPGVGTDTGKVTRGKIVSVFSSKGGSGKTFLTTNLSAAIADITQEDTAVIDLDVDMGDVFAYFGREPTASVQDLMELGEGTNHDRIREVGVKLGEHLWGFGAPSDPSTETPSGEAIGKFLRSIRNDFAYVVVDASVDYSDSALVCFDLSDTICLVTSLDVVGVRHLSKSLDTLLSIGLPRDRFRVVLNRADSKVGLDPSDVERVMKIQVDAMIPSSRLVPSSLNKGRPIVLEEPTSEVSTAVRFVAQKLTGQLAEGGSAVTEAAADKKRMKKQRKPKDPPDQNPKQQRKLFSRSA